MQGCTAIKWQRGASTRSVNSQTQSPLIIPFVQRACNQASSTDAHSPWLCPELCGIVLSPSQPYSFENQLGAGVDHPTYPFLIKASRPRALSLLSTKHNDLIAMPAPADVGDMSRCPLSLVSFILVIRQLSNGFCGNRETRLNVSINGKRFCPFIQGETEQRPHAVQKEGSVFSKGSHSPAPQWLGNGMGPMTACHPPKQLLFVP